MLAAAEKLVRFIPSISSSSFLVLFPTLVLPELNIKITSLQCIA
jgi:hypothetical protein